MGIENLTEKMKQAYYQRPQGEPIEDRVAHIVARLQEDPHYAKCSEDELISIAISMYGNGIIENITTQLEGYVTATGKPMDPVWGQFTYDEILGMANDGVQVPQEFLDWANAMADTDTTAYEIEESASSDSNTASNLEVGTDDTTRMGQQRKLQKFSSKAEQQEELLREKDNELQAQSQDLESVQTDLEKNQKLTLDKINQISNEFDTLNNKVKNGETLTDEEMRRYKELGLLLNTQGEELIAQSNNVEADIEALLTQMEDVSNLVNVNKDISRTLENLSLLYSAAEGGKTHSYSYGGSNGLNTFGVMEAYSYAAQGMSVASNSGVIGVELDLNSNALQFKANANAEIANTTLTRVQSIESQGESLNPDKNTTNRIAENQANQAPAEEENTNGENTQQNINPEENNTPPAQNGAQNTEPETNTDTTLQQTLPGQDETLVLQPFETEPQTNEVPQTRTTEENIVENMFNSVQTGNVTEEAAAQVLDNIAPDNTVQANNVPQTTNTAQTGAAATVSTTEGETAVEDTTATENTTETDAAAADTPAEAQTDPEEAAIREYLTGCNTKSTEMQTITNNLTALRDQVKDIRQSRLKDTIKAKAEFDSAFSQYENLLGRIRNATEISDADQAEYERLNGILDAQTGSLSVDMQNKITVLNDFSTTVESGLTLSSENLTYADSAIEAGKAYALENNAGSQDKIRLSDGKDGIYDRLYGKEGESVGRDVIESGEALAKQTKSARRVLVFSSSLNGFASQYSSQLTDNMNENNAKVAPLAQEFQQLFAAKTAAQETPAETTAQETTAQGTEITDQTIPAENNTQIQQNEQPEAAQNNTNTATEQTPEVQNQLPETQDVQANTLAAADTQQTLPEQTTELPQQEANVTETIPEATPVGTTAEEITTNNTANQNDEITRLQLAQSGIRSITNDNTTVNNQINSLSSQAEDETAVVDNASDIAASGGTVSRSINSASEFSNSRVVSNSINNADTDVEENISTLGGITEESQEIIVDTTDSSNTINSLNTTENNTARANNEPEAPQNPTENIPQNEAQQPAETPTPAPEIADIEIRRTAANVQNDAADGLDLTSQISAAAEEAEAIADEGQVTGAAINVDDEIDTASARAKETGSEVEADSGIAELKEAESEAIATAGTDAVREIDASTAQSYMPALNTPEDGSILQNTRGTVETGVEDTMEAISEQVEEQMATQLAKSAAQKNTEDIVEDLVTEAGQQTIREYGGRLQQKDSKEDNKKKVLMQFERKKRDAIKRGIEEVKKSMNAK